MQTANDFMFQALNLARQGTNTSPNPRVGCVIVKDQQIIGTGFHQIAGGPHAEIFALQEAGANARGAHVYVTLEPCCHTGKTPPCILSLIAAEVSHVTIACRDPNPLVAGLGIQALEQAGITVTLGVLQQEAEHLNRHFFHYITKKRPFVIGKWAMSLDGKTTPHPADSKQITGHAAQTHVHQLRDEVDAILIGAETARQDDPRLTVRLKNKATRKQPLRIILSQHGHLPADLQLFTDQAAPTLLITSTPSLHHPAHVENLVLAANEENKIDLNLVLAALGKKQITSLLVEGGMNLLDQFITQNLLNEVQVYIAPTLIGNLNKKAPLTKCTYQTLENDFLITAPSGETYV